MEAKDAKEPMSIAINFGRAMDLGKGISKQGFMVRFYTSQEPKPETLVSELFFTPDSFMGLADKIMGTISNNKNLFK